MIGELPIPDDPALIRINQAGYIGDSNCTRGYEGTWAIKDGFLFLVHMQGLYEKTNEEPMMANWVTGVIKVGEDEKFGIWKSDWGKERHITIEKGRFIKSVAIDTGKRKADPRQPIINRLQPLRAAVSLAREGEFTKAERLLCDFVSHVPPGWKPVKETEKQLEIAFWNETEFLNYVLANTASKNIVFVEPSYSQAYYLLGTLAVEQRNYDNALDYLDKAIELEPDNPLTLCEKALLLSNQGSLYEAAELYLKAHDARPWADKFHKARALRGAGVCLIDLGMLDKAEHLLEISLKLEVGNKMALKELDHIQYLRAGGTPTQADHINTLYM